MEKYLLCVLPFYVYLQNNFLLKRNKTLINIENILKHTAYTNKLHINVNILHKYVYI